MELECRTSGFHHLCLLAEDGTVYSDDSITCVPEDGTVNGTQEFLPYFEGGKKKVFAQMHDKGEEADPTNKSIFYGVRLDGLEVGDTKMFALIGMSEISSIQDKIVIDSFIKDGVSRGHGALIDMDGDYIIDVTKKIYHDKSDNLYEHLSESENSELTNGEIAQKLKKRETFGFYHLHEGGRQGIVLFYPICKGYGFVFCPGC